MQNALIFFFLMICIIGCAKAPLMGASWDPQDAQFFDDGIDIIEDYSKLSGAWAFEAEEELNARVELADFIAKVNVVSIQTNQDIDGQEEKRIQVVVQNSYYGEGDAKNFILISTRRAKGYILLNRYESKLEGEQLLFLRIFTKEDGSVGYHFHFSPHVPTIIEKVKKLIEKRVSEEEKNVI